jgi:hypothetical protein
MLLLVVVLPRPPEGDVSWLESFANIVVVEEQAGLLDSALEVDEEAELEPEAVQNQVANGNLWLGKGKNRWLIDAKCFSSAKKSSVNLVGVSIWDSNVIEPLSALLGAIVDRKSESHDAQNIVFVLAQNHDDARDARRTLPQGGQSHILELDVVLPNQSLDLFETLVPYGVKSPIDVLLVDAATKSKKDRMLAWVKSSSFKKLPFTQIIISGVGDAKAKPTSVKISKALESQGYKRSFKNRNGWTFVKIALC